MKRFRFRLEKILRYKTQIEDRKKQVLTERTNELNIEKSRLHKIENSISLYGNRYSSLFKGRLNIRGLQHSRRFLDKLSNDRKYQNDRVLKSEKKADAAKADLRAAMRDRKKYEKLEERKKRAYDYEMNRVEQKEFDEFGSKMKKPMGIAPESADLRL